MCPHSSRISTRLPAINLPNSAAYATDTSASCLPQMTSVGATIRWMRFARPLSGIGQTNFDVQPIAHVRPTIAAMAASGSSGGVNMARATSPSGSWKSSAGSCSGAAATQLATGWSSSQRPIGSSSTSRLKSVGKCAASSQASMPPNDWPTTAGRSRFSALIVSS